MVDPFYYANKEHVGGIGTSLGVDLDQSNYFQTNLEITQRFYATGNDQLLISAVESFNISQNFQLKAKYMYKDKYAQSVKQQEDNFQLLINYYF